MFLLSACVVASTACGVKGAPLPPATPQASEPAPLEAPIPGDGTAGLQETAPAQKKKKQQ